MFKKLGLGAWRILKGVVSVGEIALRKGAAYGHAAADAFGKTFGKINIAGGMSILGIHTVLRATRELGKKSKYMLARTVANGSKILQNSIKDIAVYMAIVFAFQAQDSSEESFSNVIVPVSFALGATLSVSSGIFGWLKNKFKFADTIYRRGIKPPRLLLRAMGEGALFKIALSSFIGVLAYDNLASPSQVHSPWLYALIAVPVFLKPFQVLTAKKFFPKSDIAENLIVYLSSSLIFLENFQKTYAYYVVFLSQMKALEQDSIIDGEVYLTSEEAYTIFGTAAFLGAAGGLREAYEYCSKLRTFRNSQREAHQAEPKIFEIPLTECASSSPDHSDEERQLQRHNSSSSSDTSHSSLLLSEEGSERALLPASMLSSDSSLQQSASRSGYIPSRVPGMNHPFFANSSDEASNAPKNHEKKPRVATDTTNPSLLVPFLPKDRVSSRDRAIQAMEEGSSSTSQLATSSANLAGGASL